MTRHKNKKSFFISHRNGYPSVGISFCILMADPNINIMCNVAVEEVNTCKNSSIELYFSLAYIFT